MINDTIYLKIFNIIKPLLPDEWEKLVVYIGYGNESYNMSFYVGVNGKMIKCFDLPDADQKDILLAYSEINKIVSVERDKEADKWSSMTLVVVGDDFHADFDYSEIPIGDIDYKKEWEKKYIG